MQKQKEKKSKATKQKSYQHKWIYHKWLRGDLDLSKTGERIAYEHAVRKGIIPEEDELYERQR
jgi:hypothetical protein